MATTTSKVVRKVVPIKNGPMSTLSPFLFFVYHRDLYPAGNATNMDAPRIGNGADFDWDLPYRMYHGERVPGFPSHPHRGFETMTAVRKGICDHTDSLGNSGRFGGDGLSSDLCWMTAGKGIVHGELFPLVNTDKDNTLQLFQIWLNLPAKSKMAPPGFKMYYAERAVHVKGTGGASVEVIAGRLGNIVSSDGAKPPPDSWAADAENDVAVFLATLPPGGRIELPPAVGGALIGRMAYVVEGPRTGEGVSVGGVPVPASTQGRAAFELRGDVSCVLENSPTASAEVWIMILQGKPIDEPIAQHGPFVMTSDREIQQAFADYRKTGFGGWPWGADAVVFDRTQGRFGETVGSDGKKVRELPPPPVSVSSNSLKKEGGDL